MLNLLGTEAHALSIPPGEYGRSHQRADCVVMSPVGILSPRVKPKLGSAKRVPRFLWGHPPRPAPGFMWGRPPSAVQPGKARPCRNKDAPGVPHPNAIRRPPMKTNIREHHISLLQKLANFALRRRIIDNQLHPLMPCQIANDLGINPRNRLKLSRPIPVVVRPREPCCSVWLPLGGHAVAGWCRGRT